MNIALLLLPDFLLLLIGAGLRRWARFDPPFWSGLERLIYYVLFPALLFRALAKTPLSAGSTGPAWAIAATFMLVGAGLSFLPRRLFRMPPTEFAACYQCGFRFNTYIGLAIAGRVYGDAGVAAAGLLAGLMVPIANLASVAVLTQASGGSVWRELARNPLILGCLAGFAWNAGGLDIPAPLLRILDLFATAAIPMGLLAVGAGLRFQSGVLSPLAAGWWLAVKHLAIPAIAFLLVSWIGLPSPMREVVVLMAALPTATSAYILAVRLGSDGRAVALLISTSTLLGMATIPVWLACLAR